MAVGGDGWDVRGGFRCWGRDMVTTVMVVVVTVVIVIVVEVIDLNFG